MCAYVLSLEVINFLHLPDLPDSTETVAHGGQTGLKVFVKKTYCRSSDCKIFCEDRNCCPFLYFSLFSVEGKSRLALTSAMQAGTRF